MEISDEPSMQRIFDQQLNEYKTYLANKTAKSGINDPLVSRLVTGIESD